jgi:hypothetical protein
MLASPRQREKEADVGRNPFDRQDWAVVLLGWAVALWMTLG